MRNIRFERLFNRNERAVIIAMDHCEFDGPIPGMVDLSRTAWIMKKMPDEDPRW